MSSDFIYSNSFKPTFLYLKRHRITGMMYFGITTRNVEQYLGSGTRWLHHIKVHGNNVETLWYMLFLSQEDLSEFATTQSKIMDIVNSDKFANLREERGAEIVITQNHSNQHIKARRLGLPTKLSTTNSREQMLKIRKMRDKLSERARAAISTGKAEYWKTVVDVQCPHCAKVGRGPNMQRYHFDNCKYTSQIKLLIGYDYL